MADEIGLLVAHKPDSQDICFVPDGDYASFIENTTDQVLPTGNFVTPEGKVLGKHKGIIHYTVGQRKGLGLALGYPAFVLEIRPETNEVVIGTYEESLTYTVRANELNFMSVEQITEPVRIFARSAITIKEHGVLWNGREKMKSSVHLMSRSVQQHRGRQWYYMTENMYLEAEQYYDKK